jgi:hypothetical protein
MSTLTFHISWQTSVKICFTVLDLIPFSSWEFCENHCSGSSFLLKGVNVNFSYFVQSYTIKIDLQGTGWEVVDGINLAHVQVRGWYEQRNKPSRVVGGAEFLGLAEELSAFREWRQFSTEEEEKSDWTQQRHLPSTDDTKHTNTLCS